MIILLNWGQTLNWSEIRVTLNLTEFIDYSQPNKALAEGDIDVNAFQHIYFLNN
jgi:ABC-type metal ion transport system substrate-binding protein